MAKKAKSSTLAPSNPVHDFYEAIGAFGRFANGIQETHSKGGDQLPLHELDKQREKLLDRLRKTGRLAIASAVVYSGEIRREMSVLVNRILSNCTSFEYPTVGDSGFEEYSFWRILPELIRGLHELDQINAVVQMRMDLENKRVEMTKVLEPQPESPKPRWDGTRLWYDEIVVKDYRRKAAVSQGELLQHFQDAGWKETVRILPENADTATRRNLNDTVRHLNNKKTTDVITFHTDGSGLGVRWEKVGDAP